MEIESYKVQGSKSSSKKLVYYFLFSGIWYLIQSPMQKYVTGCHTELSQCTHEQVNLTLKLIPFGNLPLALFSLFIVYYSLKVLINQKLPPNGHEFPFTINKVIKRDHYTFGFSGIILGVITILAILKHAYDLYSLTNI